MTEAKLSPGRKASTLIPQAADKAVLFLSFLAGVVGIVGMKFQGFAQWQVTSWPVAVLFFYAVMVIILKRFRLREDQVGDNCYYLGLLFTLTSLSLALYQFQSGSEAASRTEAIVTDFGIALVSTIAGLFLRVFFNQFRLDPIEIEREARQELAAAASRLRSELSTTVTEFNHYVRSLRQSIEEAMTGVAAEANARVSQTTEKLGEVAKAVLEALDKDQKAHGESMTRLKNAAENAAAAIGRVAERIEKIEAPADLLSVKLAPAIDKIDRAAEAAGRRAEAEADQIARLEEVLAQTIKGAELADQRLQAVARTVSELEGLGATVAALRRSLEGGMGAIPETLEKHQRLLEDLKSAAARRTEEATASFNNAIRRQDEVRKSRRLAMASWPPPGFYTRSTIRSGRPCAVAWRWPPP